MMFSISFQPPGVSVHPTRGRASHSRYPRLPTRANRTHTSHPFRILKESARLEEFFLDPQRFMDQVASILKYELHRLLVNGIKYEKLVVDGKEAEWEMELFKSEEIINYLSALQVKHSSHDFDQFTENT